jgi:hypothetical protein
MAEPETIHVKGEGGMVIAMDLPLPDHIEHRLRGGLLRRVNEDGSPYTGPDDGAPAAPTEAPKASASKQAWVEWAVACGADPEEASGMTRADLTEKYAEATPV